MSGARRSVGEVLVGKSPRTSVSDSCCCLAEARLCRFPMTDDITVTVEMMA